MSTYTATGHIVRQLSASPTAPPAGGGDMYKSVYDSNNDGKVGAADNADTLAGQMPAYYLNRSNHTGQQPPATITGTNPSQTLADDLAALYAGLAASVTQYAMQSAINSAVAGLESSANKSNDTNDSASTSKFPVWSAIVAFFSTTRIQSILGDLLGIRKSLSGDFTFTTNTANTVPELTINLQANKHYQVRLFAHVGCASTGGVRLAINTSSGSTWAVSNSPSTSTTAFFNQLNTDSGLPSTATNRYLTTHGVAVLEGTILTTTTTTVTIVVGAGVSGQQCTLYQLGTSFTASLI
jgi:hypothetical protein